MPERFSLNDWMLGTRSNDDSGRPGYTMQVSFAGSGATSPQVQGTAAGGTTTAGNPVKVGGVYNTSPPTYTNGQQTEFQTDARGSLFVVPGTAASAAFGSGALADGASNSINRVIGVNYGLVFNGTTWDRQRKPSTFNRAPSSVAAGNPAVGKASPGDVCGFWGQNGAAITYLQIYNKATAPVIGTDTPVMTYPIPANATFTQSIPAGAYFGTGIAYAFTTDAAGTTGSAAAAIIAFNLLVA